MSRMFDAMVKGSGEASRLVASLVQSGEQVAVEPAEEPAPVVQAATNVAVLPVSPTPVPQPSSIRTMLLQVPERSPLLIFDQPQAGAAEQYRLLRTRIIHHARKPRMILVSSPDPRDGKSVTAVNLAAVLSLKAEASVLLLDGDFRRSLIDTQLGVPVSPGLSDVLQGEAPLEAALIQAQQFPNLHILPTGEAKTNPSELLETPAWRTLIEHVRQQFAYVIVDSPPVGSLADYHLLQNACDGVIVVLRPDHTNRRRALKALELVPKEKLLGVVINCAEDWLLWKTQSYSYYYGRAHAAK